MFLLTAIVNTRVTHIQKGPVKNTPLKLSVKFFCVKFLTVEIGLWFDECFEEILSRAGHHRVDDAVGDLLGVDVEELLVKFEGPKRRSRRLRGAVGGVRLAVHIVGRRRLLLHGRHHVQFGHARLRSCVDEI